MKKYVIQESTLSSIANAIRGKLGNNTTYTPDEMASAILSIPYGLYVDADNYLTFQCLFGDNAIIGLTAPASFGIQLEYRKNNGSWQDWNVIESDYYDLFDKISLNIEDYVCIRAKTINDWRDSSMKDYIHFYFGYGLFSCGGNIMSLLSNDLSVTELPCNYAFYRLFYGCSNLISAPELPATALTSYCYYSMFQECLSLQQAPELPATSLADYCYDYMFEGCSNLVIAPELLPATTLASGCYANMFNNCSSLVTTPELPATALVSNCYSNMFQGCSSLVTAPELPATTLANSCYSNMFNNCSSLVTAPELPATTLANSCYSNMFNNCSNLNYIKVGATSWNKSYTANWVQGVSASGTFDKPTSLTVGTGSGQIPSGATNGIPSGWTVVNY